VRCANFLYIHSVFAIITILISYPLMRGSLWPVASSSQLDESTSLTTPGDVKTIATAQDFLARQSINYTTDVVETAETLVHLSKAVGRSKRHRSNRTCSSAITAWLRKFCSDPTEQEYRLIHHLLSLFDDVWRLQSSICQREALRDRLSVERCQ